MATVQKISDSLEAVKNLRYKGGHRYDSQYDLPPALKKYVKLVGATYDETNPDVGQYKIDPELSTKQFKVYRGNNKIFFGIRGSTEIVNDFLINDTQIARGVEHLQLKQAREKMAEIQKKYPNETVVTGGHSLAGLTSAMIGKEFGIKSYSIYPGGTSLGDEEHNKKLTGAFKGNSLNHTLISQGDAVSMAMI